MKRKQNKGKCIHLFLILALLWYHSIGHSMLLASCQTMCVIMLTHRHNLPSLPITACVWWKARSERTFTLYWIHCSRSNSDLSTACVCRIKPTWACSPGGQRACLHIFTRWKEGLILYVMRQTHQTLLLLTCYVDCFRCQDTYVSSC